MYRNKENQPSLFNRSTEHKNKDQPSSSAIVHSLADQYTTETLTKCINTSLSELAQLLDKTTKIAQFVVRQALLDRIAVLKRELLALRSKLSKSSELTQPINKFNALYSQLQTMSGQIASREYAMMQRDSNYRKRMMSSHATNNKYEEAMEQLLKKEEKIKQLQKQLDNRDQEIDDMNSQLFIISKQKSALNKQIYQLEERYHDMEKQMKGMEGHIKELEEQIELHGKNYWENKETIQKLEKSERENMEVLERGAHEIQMLHGELKELERKLIESDKLLQTRSQQVGYLTTRLQEQDKEILQIQHLKDEVGIKNMQIARLQEDYRWKQITCGQLLVQIQQLLAEKTERQTQLQQKHRDNQALALELRATMALKAEYASAQRQIQEYEDLLIRTEDRTQNLEVQLETQKKKNDQMHKDIEEQVSISKAYLGEIEKIKLSYVQQRRGFQIKYKQEAQKYEKRIKQLESERDAIRHSEAIKQREFQAATGRAEAGIQELRRLVAHLQEDLQNSRNSIEQRNAQYAKEKEQHQEEMNRMKEKCTRLEKSIENQQEARRLFQINQDKQVSTLREKHKQELRAHEARFKKDIEESEIAFKDSQKHHEQTEADLKAQLRQLQKENQTKHKEIEELKRGATLQAQKIRQFEETINIMRNQIRILKSSENETHKHNQVLKDYATQLESLKQQYETSSLGQQEALNKEIRNHKSTKESLQREIASLKRVVGQLQDKIEQSRIEYNSLEEELSRSKEQANRVISSLKAENQCLKQSSSKVGGVYATQGSKPRAGSAAKDLKYKVLSDIRRMIDQYD